MSEKWTVEDLDAEIERLRGERDAALRAKFLRNVRDQVVPMMIDALRAMEDDKAFYQRVVQMRELLAHLEYQTRSGQLRGVYAQQCGTGLGISGMNQQMIERQMMDIQNMQHVPMFSGTRA